MKTAASKWPELVVSTPSLHKVFGERGVDLATARVYSATSMSSLFHLAYQDEAPTCLDSDHGDVFDFDTPLPVIGHPLVAVIIQSPQRSSSGVEVHGVVYSEEAGIAVLLVRWSEGEGVDISCGYDANHLSLETGFYGGQDNGLIVHAALQCIVSSSGAREVPTFEDRHATKKYKGLNLSARPYYRLRAKFCSGKRKERSGATPHRRSEHDRLQVAYAVTGSRACKHWESRGYTGYTRRTITGEVMARLADRGRRMPGPNEKVLIKSVTIPAVDVAPKADESPSTPATGPASPSTT